MDYRLLLDWIDMPGDHFSVDQELEFSADVLADPAKAHLSFRNVAVSSACCASDPRIGQWLVEERFLDRGYSPKPAGNEFEPAVARYGMILADLKLLSLPGRR